MGYVIAWFLLAAMMLSFFTKRLKRAPYQGIPDEATRFFISLEHELGERHPDVTVVGMTTQGFGAVLRVDRQELAVPLGEVFLRQRAFPSAFGQTVDRLVGELRDHLAAIQDLPFDEAVSHILPQIRPAEWLAHNSPAFGPGRVLSKELFEGLVTCWVLDEGDSIVFVTEGHLDAWGCRLDDIENLALGNLKRLAEQDGSFVLPEPDSKEPTVVSTGDGYDASRLLLAMRSVDDVEGLVFAIPDRDTLVVANGDGDIARLMGEVGAEFERGEHPISPALFEVDATGIKLASDRP